MFDGMKRKIAATALSALLKSLATSHDTKTTIIGLIAGTILAVHGLDLTALISGDPLQVAHVLSGVCVAAIGFLCTKENADGKTTLVGVLAGALQAASGSVDAIITGLVLAVLGYITNKPGSAALPPKVSE
jgi:primosomal replication protein N